MFSGWNTAADGSGASFQAGNSFTIGTANITLYARWSLIPPHNLIYNGNGNTSGSAPIDGSAYTNGQSATVSGNTGNLILAGYSFIGWNTAANGSGTGYTNGQQLTMGTNNITLYAQWNLIPTYGITYNGNQNSGGSVPVDLSTYTNGQSVTVMGNSGSLTKTGFAFAGWNTLASGTGLQYNPGQMLVMGSVNVILYAVWSATYSVTYTGNGNNGGNPPIDGNLYTNGQIVTVLGNTGAMTCNSKTFTGWNTQAGGGGITYTQGQTFSMSYGIILYALWTSNLTYSVTYNTTGSTGGSAPNDSTQYQTGQQVTVQGNIGYLVKAGFVLSAWSNTNNTVFSFSQTFSMGPDNVNLYPVWTQTYTVTYSGNGSTGGNAPVDGNAYTNGQTVTVSGNTGGLTIAGFIFSKWNTQAGGGGSSYSAGNTFAMGSGNMTLYAQWTATYTVTYNGNSSSGGMVPTDPNYYSTGQLITVSGNTGNLVKTESIFSSWSNTSGSVYTAGQTFTMGTANVTLYAVWAPTYTVTYNGNNNTSGSVPVDNGNYLPGAYVTVPGNTGNLVRSGYLFNGWNTAANGSGTTYNSGQQFSMGASNITLYALWTSVSIYTVTYNSNGSSSGTVPIDGNTYSNGQTVTVLGNTGNLVKTGYIFGGWNTAANGSGTAYINGQTFSMGLANVTLYAIWDSYTYTVSFNSQGGTLENSINVTSPSTATGALPAAPVLAGCTFTGWYTSQYGGGTVFTASSLVTANITVYAAWQIDLAPIPSGTFQYDGTNGDICTLSSFHMSTYDITRAEFTAFTGLPDPTDTNTSTGISDPVQKINWYMAIYLCNILSMEENLIPVYTINGSLNPSNWVSATGGMIPTNDNAAWDSVTANLSASGFSLPTEMQYMWAAMGATNDALAGDISGGTNTGGYAKGYAGSTEAGGAQVNIGLYAWYTNNSGNSTHPVGLLLPNELGLYDMRRKCVLQWCWDWYTPFPGGPLTNYQGGTSITNRERRGGSFSLPASDAAISHRGAHCSMTS